MLMYLFTGNGSPRRDDVSDHPSSVPSNCAKDIEKDCKPTFSLSPKEVDIGRGLFRRNHIWMVRLIGLR